MAKISQAHVSNINTWLRCRRQFYYSQIKGIKSPPGIFAIQGTSVHKTIADNFTRVLVDGSLMSIPEIQDTARDHFVHTLTYSEVIWTAEDVERGISKLKGEALDKSVAMSTVHAKNIAPLITPKAVEWKWVLVPQGFPFTLGGRMDLLAEDMGEYAVWDAKTANKSKNQQEVDSSLQLTVYSLAAMKKLNLNYLPDVGYHVLVSTKKPKYQVLTSRRSMHNVKLFLRLLEMFAESIEREDWSPCDPGAWQCSPKWCGYWNICPWGARSRVTG